MYELRTRYHLRGGKMTGMIAVDIAARPTYPVVANQKGILSLRNISSLRFCSINSLELSPSVNAHIGEISITAVFQ
jgi:hypothetical protein